MIECKRSQRLSVLKRQKFEIKNVGDYIQHSPLHNGTAGGTEEKRFLVKSEILMTNCLNSLQSNKAPAVKAFQEAGM